MHSLSRSAVLVLIGVTLVLHCAEEYSTFPAFFSSPEAMPQWLHPHGLLYNAHHMRAALVMAAALPLGVIAWQYCVHAIGSWYLCCWWKPSCW